MIYYSVMFVMFDQFKEVTLYKLTRKYAYHKNVASGEEGGRERGKEAVRETTGVKNVDLAHSDEWELRGGGRARDLTPCLEPPAHALFVPFRNLVIL